VQNWASCHWARFSFVDYCHEGPYFNGARVILRLVQPVPFEVEGGGILWGWSINFVGLFCGCLKRQFGEHEKDCQLPQRFSFSIFLPFDLPRTLHPRNVVVIRRKFWLNPRRLTAKAFRTVDYSVYGVGWYEHGNLGMGRSNEANTGNQKHIFEPEQTPRQARVVNPNLIQ
jgi:hypothetical protein